MSNFTNRPVLVDEATDQAIMPTTNDLLYARIRRTTSQTLPIPEELPTIAETAVGRLEMLDTESIQISDDRFRSKESDTQDLELSIHRTGQIVPIMVRSDLTLVSGYRRVKACENLGIKVLAHVVDIADPQDAEIEEDRCRKNLNPYEMYLVTEALRPRIEDDAWARKLLGKRIEKAKTKGRVDDILAQHVGISRGTLRKIREIVEAWTKDNAKFDDLMVGLKADGKVDRHYREFQRLQRSIYDGPKVAAQLIKADWQEAFHYDPDRVRKAFSTLGSSDVVEEDAVVVIPTSVALLPQAIDLVSAARAKVRHAYNGGDSGQELWLLASSTKKLALEQGGLELLESACSQDFDEVLQWFGVIAPKPIAVISIFDALNYGKAA